MGRFEVTPFADAGSFLPPPQGPYRHVRNDSLYADKNTNITCVSPLKNTPSAAKLLRNNTYGRNKAQGQVAIPSKRDIQDFIRISILEYNTLSKTTQTDNCLFKLFKDQIGT